MISEQELGFFRADLPHGPGNTPAGDTRQRYRDLLMRLAALAGVPMAEHETVIAHETLVLAEVPITFRLEEWSSFVKIYIDVGRPDIVDAPALHRYLLSRQLFLPAPFSLVPAVHPDNDHIVLYGYSPMPADTQGDEALLGFLQGCVYVCEVLRSGSVGGMAISAA